MRYVYLFMCSGLKVERMRESQGLSHSFLLSHVNSCCILIIRESTSEGFFNRAALWPALTKNPERGDERRIRLQQRPEKYVVTYM